MKRILSLFIISFLLLVPASSEAAVTIAKIISQPDTGADPMTGSGMVFSFDGKLYILTADHVFYRQNKGYTHVAYVMNTQNKLQKLKLLMKTVDWAYGIGIFEVQPSPGVAINAPDLNYCDENHLQHVSFQAYPADSYEPLIDENVEAPQRVSAVQSLLDVDYYDEYDVAQAEFGMSGGAAIGENDCFAGILSRQQVSGKVNKIFVIPPSAIQRWMTKWRKDIDHFKPKFYDNYFLPDSKNFGVSSGGVSFEMYYDETARYDQYHPLRTTLRLDFNYSDSVTDLFDDGHESMRRIKAAVDLNRQSVGRIKAPEMVITDVTAPNFVTFFRRMREGYPYHGVILSLPQDNNQSTKKYIFDLFAEGKQLAEDLQKPELAQTLDAQSKFFGFFTEDYLNDVNESFGNFCDLSEEFFAAYLNPASQNYLSTQDAASAPARLNAILREIYQMKRKYTF